MQILNAIMLEKRVLLLGRLRPVGQIVRWVLSAVMLACPPYHGLLDQRVFPYASLVNMTWMETPAYIAGTVNPLVEVKPGWWDVLCDLDNGKVVIQVSAPFASAFSASLFVPSPAASLLFPTLPPSLALPPRLSPSSPPPAGRLWCPARGRHTPLPSQMPPPPPPAHHAPHQHHTMPDRTAPHKTRLLLSAGGGGGGSEAKKKFAKIVPKFSGPFNEFDFFSRGRFF